MKYAHVRNKVGANSLEVIPSTCKVYTIYNI